jgi:hypothetical protein
MLFLSYGDAYEASVYAPFAERYGLGKLLPIYGPTEGSGRGKVTHISESKCELKRVFIFNNLQVMQTVIP